MFFCRCTLHSRPGSGRIQEAKKGRLENDFACSSWYLLKVNEAYSDTIIFLKKALPLQVNFDQFRMTILPTNIFFALLWLFVIPCFCGILKSQYVDKIKSLEARDFFSFAIRFAVLFNLTI